MGGVRGGPGGGAGTTDTNLRSTAPLHMFWALIPKTIMILDENQYLGHFMQGP